MLFLLDINMSIWLSQITVSATGAMSGPRSSPPPPADLLKSGDPARSLVAAAARTLLASDRKPSGTTCHW
jgi:hypothetical protein